MATSSPELGRDTIQGGWGRARAAIGKMLRMPLGMAVVLIGVAALVVPTLVSLARDYWSTDNGVHGPLILVSGAWLVWREREVIHYRPGSISGWWLIGALPPLLLLYAYGRLFSVLVVETGALYAILILLGLYYWGARVMRRLWFAVLYLGFLVRPPSAIVAELTQPLKIWLSNTSVSILHGFGYEVGNTGVAIQIAQYELLVQQACAGLGSIFSLLAIGLLYLHLTYNSSRVRSIILLLGIVPIAVLSNLIRVIVIVLITYYAGDAVAQSAAHELMGVITFTCAILGMFALDGALSWLLNLKWPKRRRRRARVRGA